MYRIEFIDNCNKLRVKKFDSLENCNFEVINFIIGVYDEYENLLHQKYLILTDLERSFYNRLSQISANFLIENKVLQPVVRTIFNENMPVVGNNSVSSVTKKFVATPDYGQIEYIDGDSMEKMNISTRFVRLILVRDNVGTLQDNDVDFISFRITTRLGNVSKTNIISKAQYFSNNELILQTGFLNTDLFNVSTNFLIQAETDLEQTKSLKFTVNGIYF